MSWHRLATAAARQHARHSPLLAGTDLRSRVLAGRTAAPALTSAAMGLIPKRNLSGTPAGEGSTQHAFQADTSKLLNIVSHSLYSERDVFLRELISNASDALQKHAPDFDAPRSIVIETNKVNKSLSITDNGVGMSREEMLANLGTIGKSGSQEVGKSNAGIIGQFGVGFYSVFMACRSVSVTSRPVGNTAGEAFTWKSEGRDSFSIEPAAATAVAALAGGHGTRIELELNEDAHEFCDPARLKEIIRKYSNYVAFPVLVDGERVNASDALWAIDPATITPDRYAEFYKKTYDDFEPPQFTLHFRTDVPLDIKALMFVGKKNQESITTRRLMPSVALHARRVLVDSNPEQLLPGWARFVKGIVDSEDLPLSISRESATNSQIVKRIGQVVVKKLVRFLRDKAKDEPAAYNSFWSTHGMFIKEGVCSDYPNQVDLAKLLRFDTSMVKAGEPPVSLDEVVSRCEPGRKKLYYLSAPSRALAEASPYFEIFKKRNIEVIFLYHVIDDFSMGSLGSYEGRTLVAADSKDVMADLAGGPANETEAAAEQELCSWFAKALGSDLVTSVKPSRRIEHSPALVVDHQSVSVRRMLSLVGEQQRPGGGQQQLEINPSHAVIKAIDTLRKGEDQSKAELLARLVYDQALVQAGLVEDAREMLPRWNEVLVKLL